MTRVWKRVRRRLFQADAYQLRVETERAHHRKLAEASAVEGEVRRFSPKVPAFEHAMGLYGPWLTSRMPHLNLENFVLERQREAERSLKLLTLGCGTGDWEVGLARSSGKRLAVELVDLVPELLTAAQKVAERDGLAVSTRGCDVNRIEIPSGAYDFILCRSSLHHFIELEHVLDQVSRGLAPGGVFLVLGEWIGRKGLQIYPETEPLIQAFFRALPERLRRDAYTEQIRTAVPNMDHGVNSFEARRSDEILPLLLERLRPVEYVAYDAMVTPLLDFRFGPNYDLSRSDDRALIEGIVRMDMAVLEAGMMKPTALCGIFAAR